MAEKARQTQRLEAIYRICTYQIWLACEQADDVVDFAGGCGFEDIDGNSFIGEKRCDPWLVVIGSDHDWTKTIFFGMNQDRVQHEAAFHFILIALFDRVEKLSAHIFPIILCE